MPWSLYEYVDVKPWIIRVLRLYLDGAWQWQTVWTLMKHLIVCEAI